MSPAVTRLLERLSESVDDLDRQLVALVICPSCDLVIHRAAHELIHDVELAAQ